jgi:hypothetical protein
MKAPWKKYSFVLEVVTSAIDRLFLALIQTIQSYYGLSLRFWLVGS